MGSVASGQTAEPAPTPPAATTPLPAVTVEAAPVQKKAAKRKAAAKTKSGPQVSGPAPAPKPTNTNNRAGETATGPVKGIVAPRSATGTKTDTPLIETPQSVSVITADRIEQQRATSINEALGYTAGIMPSVYGIDSRFDWISIRGFDAYQPGFFIDGMLARNNNTWSVWKVEPYGAERIEVLKGPPSVLYGQANVGGMVNVISKRPLDEPLNEVQVSVGNHNRVESDFDFSGAASKDGKVLYRLTGVVLDTDTQVDFTEQSEVYIAPALTWRPSAGTSLTLLSQYRKDDTIPAQGTYLPNPHAEIRRSLFVGEPDYDKFDREQWSAGYLFEHRLDSVWQVRQSLRYASVDVDYKNIFSAGSTDGITLDRSTFTADETAHLFTTDNQAQANFVTGIVKHTLLAGLDYQNNNYDSRLGFGFQAAPTLNLNNPVYGAPVTDPDIYNDSDTTLTQTGLYLQEQAKISDRVIVTLGGRYDLAKTEVVDRLNGGTAEKNDEAFTWKAAVLYHDPSGLAPYYSYSKSFFPSGTIDPATGSTFDPETGQQHEVGIKYEMPGIRSLFTLAAFDITRQNYITYDATFVPGAFGEIRSRGIEFEATAELAKGVDLIGAYTWLPTFDITKSSTAGEAGQRQPIVPEHTASLWLHYRLQNGPLAGFGLGGGVRYIGESYGNIANTADMTVPSFTLLDGLVEYETGDWRFALNMSNIADEETITCWDACYIGAGRKTIATIRRRW